MTVEITMIEHGKVIGMIEIISDPRTGEIVQELRKPYKKSNQSISSRKHQLFFLTSKLTEHYVLSASLYFRCWISIQIVNKRSQDRIEYQLVIIDKNIH